MAVETIPRGTWGERGTWTGLQTADGGRSASITCPECGESATLTGHEIAEDGTVTPSLVCPHDGCDWHVWVRLEGWAERTTDTEEEDDG